MFHSPNQFFLVISLKGKFLLGNSHFQYSPFKINWFKWRVTLSLNLNMVNFYNCIMNEWKLRMLAFYVSIRTTPQQKRLIRCASRVPVIHCQGRGWCARTKHKSRKDWLRWTHQMHRCKSEKLTERVSVRINQLLWPNLFLSQCNTSARLFLFLRIVRKINLKHELPGKD
jgi:hypothetical protein